MKSNVIQWPVHSGCVMRFKQIRKEAILLSCFFFLSFAALQAQSLSQPTIGISGGTDQIKEHTLSWTVGETAVQVWQSADQSVLLTEGLHQPVYQTNQSVLTEATFSIYPNPAQEEIRYDLALSDHHTVHLRVLDSTGKLLLQQEQPATKGHMMRISTLPAGTYLLQVQAKEGTTLFTKSFIKL